MNYTALAEKIRIWADALGLTIGFSAPNIPEKHQIAMQNWLAAGYHGDMHFFHHNQEARSDPTRLHPTTCSVISARLNYWSEDKNTSLTVLNTPSLGYLSRYALGRDYHKVLRHRLKQLCEKIETEIGPFNWRPFTDSAPIMEHALAEQSGLGFIGKHTLLIHPKAGSTFFLGEILCDLPLPADTPTTHCGCGPCTACMTICPTQAIVAPFTVDARRCISYLTIEHEGSIDPALRPLMGNRIYGCDDCQLVCPWNKFAQLSTTDDFKTRNKLNQPDLLSLWQWTEATFLHKLEGSPIRRIGYQRWRRNLAIALGNAPYDQQIMQALQNALADSDTLVVEHIHWAIAQQTKAIKPIAVAVKKSYL
ncbi:MAG: tRNA epoxyqueuosine(34) reductase QueG [Proteobacteria bacterium]|nr:tRNA epoxyqueuosine(34) reductase QueG [Pseudomonadota bacterium]